MIKSQWVIKGFLLDRTHKHPLCRLLACDFPTKWAGPDLVPSGEVSCQPGLDPVQGMIYTCPGLMVSLGHLLLVTVKETLVWRHFGLTNITTLLFVVLQFLVSKGARDFFRKLGPSS